MSGNDISGHEFYRRALPEELRREFEDAATATVARPGYLRERCS
jgi:hypothetical protein